MPMTQKPKTTNLTAIGATLVLALATGAALYHRHRPPVFLLPRLVQQQLEEIITNDDKYTAITPSDSEVCFILTSGDGSRLAKLSTLSSGALQIITNTEGVWQIATWSETQSYLPIQIRNSTFRNYPFRPPTKPAHLAVYETKSNIVTRLTADDDVIESNPVWISPSDLIFVQEPLNRPATKIKLVYSTLTRSVTTAESHPAFAQNPNLLAPSSNLRSWNAHTVHYEQDSTDFILNRSTGMVEPILKTELLFDDSPKWLRLTVDSTGALFCATPLGSTNRVALLHRIPTRKTIRLTTAHSYNAKPLGDGEGFALIASTNNCFHLQIWSAPNRMETNLFTDGWCRTYTPSPDGRRIYAEASMNAGPCGLWRYDRESRELVELLPGRDVRLSNSRLTIPLLTNVLASDRSFQIPIYHFPASPSAPYRGTVILIPPRTDQCNRHHQPRPQFLSNLGYDVVGVNYRGCEGYGTAFASLYAPHQAAKDVLDVISHLKSSHMLHEGIIALVAQSEGAHVLNEVLSTDTNQYSAIAIIRGHLPSIEAIFNRDSKPPILFAIGDADPELSRVQRNVIGLRSKGWDVAFSIFENHSHLNVSVDGRRREESTLASFLLTRGASAPPP